MCVCPDAALTFTCNILGGRATVWSGSALGCRAGGERIIVHDSFLSETFNLCDGIVGEIVGVERGNCYISRLNFTAGAGFNNTVINCLVQDDGRTTVGTSTISIIPGIHGYVFAWPLYMYVY